MKINEKELIKQIRASKNRLIWSVQDETHYITDRHWAVRYKGLPKAVLTTLFSIFAEIPCNESTLRIVGGEPTQSPLVDIKQTMVAPQSLTPAKITNVLLDIGYIVRVVENNGTQIYINNDYIEMVGNFEEPPLCSEPLRPAFFCDGDLIILPCRLTTVSHKEIIQQLIEQ